MALSLSIKAHYHHHTSHKNISIIKKKSRTTPPILISHVPCFFFFLRQFLDIVDPSLIKHKWSCVRNISYHQPIRSSFQMQRQMQMQVKPRPLPHCVGRHLSPKRESSSASFARGNVAYQPASRDARESMLDPGPHLAWRFAFYCGTYPLPHVSHLSGTKGSM